MGLASDVPFHAQRIECAAPEVPEHPEVGDTRRECHGRAHGLEATDAGETAGRPFFGFRWCRRHDGLRRRIHLPQGTSFASI